MRPNLCKSTTAVDAFRTINHLTYLGAARCDGLASRPVKLTRAGRPANRKGFATIVVASILDCIREFHMMYLFKHALYIYIYISTF